MKKLFPLLAIVMLVVCLDAQSSTPTPTGTNSFTNAPNARDPEIKTERPRSGKVPVPPEKARPIVIPKISSPIVIDGRLDEEAWKTAAVFKDFYQTTPGYNTEPSKPTEVYMMYDDHNLYIAFKCWDEKDKIRATVAKRDQLFDEDNVRVWLDTFNDQRRAYVIWFNPLGIQQDGIYTEGQGADFSVDIVMESKGVIEDWGWSVEARIPFKSLRYTAGKGKLWGFNAARTIQRFNGELDQWLPDDRDISGFLVKHGKVTGLDEIKYERTLEIVPSITVSESGIRKRTIPNAGFNTFGSYDPILNPIGLRDPGRWVNDPVKKDIGVNLKYTLTPNVTFDATINPDFAEIEADAPVVTANQRFPIFFQEKRPFFLEGKDIFDSSLQPFYSRKIVSPNFATKITGKTGRNTFGFLVASDKAPGNLSQDERGELNACIAARSTDPPGQPRTCDNEDIVDKNAFFGVLRLKHDIGKSNNIGFFATARTFPHSRNFVGGFDGTFKPNPRLVLTFQALATHSRKFFYDPNHDESDYRTGNGFGYYFSADYTTDRFGWFAEAFGRTGKYRADAGFTKRTDSNTFFFADRVSTKSKPKAFLIRGNFNQFVRYGLDFKGRMQQALVGGNANLNLQHNLFVYLETGVQWEKIYENEFGPARNPAIGLVGAFVGAPMRSATEPYFSSNFNKTVSKRLSLYGFVGLMANSFDFDFGAGPRFRRVSPTFDSYLASPQYADYLSQLKAFQANPVGTLPDINSIAPPPKLDPGNGFQFDLNLGGEYKPIDPFRISLDYTNSKLRRNDTHQTAFNTHIFSLKSTYQFSRFTFVRARWDYDTLRSAAAGQVLFGWNPNPGTAFYVGYNDNFSYNGFNPYTGHYEPGFQRNSRTFFIRTSYLFRKSF